MWKKSNITLCVLVVATILYISLVYVAIIDTDCSQHPHNESVFEKHGKRKIIVAFRNDDLTTNSNLRHEESILNVFWESSRPLHLYRIAGKVRTTARFFH